MLEAVGRVQRAERLIDARGTGNSYELLCAAVQQQVLACMRRERGVAMQDEIVALARTSILIHIAVLRCVLLDFFSATKGAIAVPGRAALRRLESMALVMRLAAEDPDAAARIPRSWVFAQSEARAAMSVIYVCGVAGVALLVAYLVARGWPRNWAVSALAVVAWIVILLEAGLSTVRAGVRDEDDPMDAEEGREPASVAVVYPVLLHSFAQVSTVCSRIASNREACEHPDCSIVVALSLGRPPNDRQGSALVAAFLASLARRLGDECVIVLRHAEFFLASHGGWACRERKRGKIEAVARLAAGQHVYDLAVLRGSIRELRGVHYLLVLDEDSVLAAGADVALVRAASSFTPGDYTFFVPSQRSGGGEGRFWFRYFGDRPFSGKGLLHVRSYVSRVAGLLPVERILSHDWLEGFLGHAAYVSSAYISEASSPNLAGHLMRLHRWCRGDVQNMLLLLLGEIALRWNAYRVAYVACMIGGIVSLLLLPLAVAMNPFVPRTWIGIIVLALLSCVAWRARVLGWRGSARGIARAFAVAPLEAAACLDAIIIALVRTISRRRMLEWQACSQHDNRGWVAERVTGLVLAACVCVGVLAILSVGWVSVFFWAVFVVWLLSLTMFVFQLVRA